MIKYVQCVRRKPDISIPEFRKYWKLYAEKAQELMAKVGGTRMSFSTALVVDQNVAIQTMRGTAAAFDGFAEIYFESAAKVGEKLQSTPENKAALQNLWDFQDKFMDLPGSSFFWASEEEEKHI